MSSENVNRGLAGLRLLSLESRRADQMARLIENHGGVGLVDPSMRAVKSWALRHVNPKCR